MVRAGLSAGIILTTIEMAPAVGVDVSAAALIDLKTAGVDDRIIEAMQTTAGTVPMEPAQPPCAAPEPSEQPAASRDPDLILRNFSTLLIDPSQAVFFRADQVKAALWGHQALRSRRRSQSPRMPA